uniref:von Willebrand factor A domain-containing protein 5B2-like n=1 Tax=Seriola dumerili TaxID=41447 RepID=A0A3B4V020_SERDU
MVGLRNRSTWEPLLLKASCIKSCANGCSLGITTHLTYANADIESVEGVFVYPLGEKEVVVGFEAAIAGRLVGVQIQNRGKLKDCCLDCCPGTGLEGHCGNGHLILDEDLERTTFIVGTGVIGPMDIVSIIISTTLELPTLENGAIHIVYPSLLTPVVTGQMTSSKSENGGKLEEPGYLSTSCFGATSGKQGRVLDSEQQCTHTIFTSPAASLAPYELNFQLLVRGACLLAGLESPTHALRADADPSAQSASATYITLAQEHPYDRHIEIILHLSEPHNPLVILERGRLSFSQYEQLICSRRDFIRCTRKDSEPERKLEFVRKRYHKDILSSPVLMLNFCPDLLCEPLELHKATRELLFLVDRSGSMSAMVVALKSLPSCTMLNVVGFGTTIKPLFTSSKLCTDYVQRMRADMRGTNLLGALSWVYQQPMQRSYPRQVFIITDGSISNVAKVLELVRRNTCAGRYESPTLNSLLNIVTHVSHKGLRYFSAPPSNPLIKSLKKAFEPVLTDVRIDWYLPENMEALLSPNEIPPLYPGNRLIGYCTLYDMTNFKAKKAEVFIKSPLSSPVPKTQTLAPAQVSLSSVELTFASWILSAIVVNGWLLSTIGVELDWSNDVRRRIQESSYIQEQYVLTRCSLSSERSLQTQSHSQSHSHIHASSNSDSAGLEKMPPPEQRSSLSHGLLFPASPLDWDNFTDPEYLFTAVPPEDPPPGQCRSRIHGLLSGRPVSWEVTVDLGHLWTPEGQETSGAEGCGGGGEEGKGGEPWEEIIHQLAARSVIRDFEKMAEKESDIGHAKRYRMKAIQTSKHCNIICMYTAFTTTDSNPNKGLPEGMDVQNTGVLQNLTQTELPLFIYSRFPLGRLRSSISSGKQIPLKSHCLSAETEKQPETEAPDYLPLVSCAYKQHTQSSAQKRVRLQLASGAFLLTEIYSDCVQIPLDRLKRASPYSLHRRSLSPPFRCTSPSAPSLSTSAKPLGAPSSHHVTFSPSSVGLSHSQSHGQADSGRGSETDVYEGSTVEPADLQGSCLLAQEDLEGSSWATAVALAWLEHRCAGYFMEWELVAAKADFWLRCQELPEGVDLAGLKGAARQLFLLLRHWDENIKLNMLCYNPNNM